MHRIDGPGATVDNKFTEGDPVGGIQATVVTDDFLNDVQEELISVLAAAGVTPVKGTQDQVLQAIYKLAQLQKATAFTAGGTATALTLTPTPAISAYATNQRFTVKFPVNAGLSPTLNVSAKGAKPLKQYDSSGAKVSAQFVADQVGDVLYDGVDFVVLDPLPLGQFGIQGAFKNLAVSSTGLSAVVTVSADALGVESAANTYQVLRNIGVAPTFANTGANGLDVGAANSQTASTWYSVWVIWNGVAAAGRLSLSAVAPTLPAGYTHKARVGWVKTDATANKYPLSLAQNGRKAQYKVAAGSNVTNLPVMSSGAATTPVAVSVSSFVPPTAISIKLVAGTTGSGFISFAPNGAYSAVPSTSYLSLATPNGHPFAGGYNASSPVPTASGEIVLESNTVYYCSSGAQGVMECLGWEDNA